jgi:hypothetical protein
MGRKRPSILQRDGVKLSSTRSMQPPPSKHSACACILMANLRAQSETRHLYKMAHVQGLIFSRNLFSLRDRALLCSQLRVVGACDNILFMLRSGNA